MKIDDGKSIDQSISCQSIDIDWHRPINDQSIVTNEISLLITSIFAIDAMDCHRYLAAVSGHLTTRESRHQNWCIPRSLIHEPRSGFSKWKKVSGGNWKIAGAPMGCASGAGWQSRPWGGCGRRFPPPSGGVWGASPRKN